MSGRDEIQSEAALKAIQKIGKTISGEKKPGHFSPRNDAAALKRRERRAAREQFVVPDNYQIAARLERSVAKGFEAFSCGQDSIQIPDRAEDFSWAASLEPDMLAAVFQSMKAMDTNGNGLISWEEFRCVLAVCDVEFAYPVTNAVQVVLCKDDCKG